jgi:hypothetical protein
MPATSTRNGRVALLAAAALALTAAFALAAPHDWNDDDDWCRNNWNGDDDRVRACEVRTLTLPKVPAILHVAPGQNGGAEVAAGKPGVVFVRARVEAWGKTKEEAEATLKQVRIVDAADGLSAEGPANKGTSKWLTGWTVNFRIEATAATALELSATNGPVGVYDMTGRMLLETQNGPIAIDRCSGDVAARTQNGPLAVVLSGTRWVGKGLSARAVNGPVSLKVPRTYDAELEYGTINGPWSGPRPAVAEGRGKDYMHVKLGKGGAPISVTTENGPFAMEHAD